MIGRQDFVHGIMLGRCKSEHPSLAVGVLQFFCLRHALKTKSGLMVETREVRTREKGAEQLDGALFRQVAEADILLMRNPGGAIQNVLLVTFLVPPLLAT